MTSTQRISLFREDLKDAFMRMVLGINVEITQECRDFYKLEGKAVGRWFFIKSINEDESLTLISTTHYELGGVKLSQLKKRNK